MKIFVFRSNNDHEPSLQWIKWNEELRENKLEPTVFDEFSSCKELNYISLKQKKELNYIVIIIIILTKTTL